MYLILPVNIFQFIRFLIIKTISSLNFTLTGFHLSHQQLFPSFFSSFLFQILQHWPWTLLSLSTLLPYRLTLMTPSLIACPGLFIEIEPHIKLFTGISIWMFNMPYDLTWPKQKSWFFSKIYFSLDLPHLT